MSVEMMHALQCQFAAHLRDPEVNPAPEHLEDRRVAIYRDLFFNNIESLLAANFPVIRAITETQRWRCLVRDFYRDHASHTPLFTEIGREFHSFLVNRNQNGSGDPGFLSELAHYEWVELAISLDETKLEDFRFNAQGDFVAKPPFLSPLAWPQHYRYPVHRIRVDFQPDCPPDQPTYLIVVRNHRDEVAFMETSLLSLQLFFTIQNNPAFSGLEAVQSIAAHFDIKQRQQTEEAGLALLNAWYERDVILGVRL
jgi:hypothetical protein